MSEKDFIRIEKALQFMEHNYADQPGLEAIAASVNMSKYHFQRIFTRWAGISPGRFQQCLTLNHAKALLGGEASVLDASLDSGLSGPGRLHDLFVTHEAVTPGEFKSGGETLRIDYGSHPSPFGECLLALTDRGICGLAFVTENDRADTLAGMRSRWPEAVWEHDPKRTGAVIERIFAPTPVNPRGKNTSSRNGEGGPDHPLHLLLRGTNFQVRVWEALLRIPPGRVARYGDVAVGVGSPKAQRAVGQALGANPVAFLIPCHRVIRGTGVLGGYRWGPERKRRLLAWETGRYDPESLAVEYPAAEYLEAEHLPESKDLANSLN